MTVHCFCFLCLFLFLLIALSNDSISRNTKPKFKCPHNKRREGQPCYFCLPVFRATSHIKWQTREAAYPLLLPEQRHYCDPHLPPLWNVEGTAVSLILSWWWWGTAVLLMRFFSRSPIYIWDRRPLLTPHLAIELVELMQEKGGGVPTRENSPTVSRPPSLPTHLLQSKHRYTDHFDTVNQLSSVLPMH